ncbi:MAG: hypothetical protein K2J14_07210, partial [Treponemataceae bacterium]|nr:hypothetical protein [Treponemataceae bacterium]
AATSAEAVNAALAEAKAKIDALPDDSATAYTVTVITNDGTTLGTVDAYKDVASVLDKIKELITDPKQVIADGKFYSEQACTTEYDTETALTGDVTVYVKLEEKKTTTYVLTPDMLGTEWENPAGDTMTNITTDGVMFRAGNNITYDSTTASIKTGGSCQKNGKNAIVFTTTGKSTVTVLFFGTNADRNVGYIEGTSANAVSSGKWSANAVTGTEMTKGSTEVVSTTFSIPKAGTYSLGAINGINITKITVEVEN